MTPAPTLRRTLRSHLPPGVNATIMITRNESAKAWAAGAPIRLSPGLQERLQALLLGEQLVLHRHPFRPDATALGLPGGEAWYLLARANRGPAGWGTVAVGGDCIRTEPKDLEEAARRVHQLSSAMVAKAASTLPDLLACHGGKKGEVMLFDKDGRKVDVPGETITDDQAASIIALLFSELLPWLNQQRQRSWRGRRPLLVPPESGSPDVFTGPNWPLITQQAIQRGLPASMLTCPPPELAELGGLTESSEPTAKGVVAALGVVLESMGQAPGSVRLLHEGAGGVASYVLPDLASLGLDTAKTLVFDKSAAALRNNATGFHQRTLAGRDLYPNLEPDSFDVLIVNGEGDQIDMHAARGIHRAGIRTVLGAANNILQVAHQDEIAAWLADHGVQVVPDPIVSPGGWTYAVLLQLLRGAGQPTQPEHKARINAFVERAVGDMVRRAIDAPSAWVAGRALIDERTSASRAANIPLDDLDDAVDPTVLLREAGVL